MSGRFCALRRRISVKIWQPLSDIISNAEPGCQRETTVINSPDKTHVHIQFDYSTLLRTEGRNPARPLCTLCCPLKSSTSDIYLRTLSSTPAAELHSRCSDRVVQLTELLSVACAHGFIFARHSCQQQETRKILNSSTLPRQYFRQRIK